MIRRFLKIPEYTDLVTKQKATLTLYGAISVLSASLIFVLMMLAEYIFNMEMPILVGPRLIAPPFLIIIPAVLILLRNRRLNLASWILVLSLLLGAALNPILSFYFDQAVTDQLFPVLLLVIILSGFLLNQAGLIILTIVVNATVIGTWALELQLFNSLIEPTPIILFVVFSTLLAAIIRINSEATRTAIINSQETSRQLIDANQQLQLAQTNAEALIEERTAILERRAQYLEAASDVGRAATSIYTLAELLDQVVQFVSERFGFYQVGIFMLDDLGEYAVLRAANSPGGKQMLARNHQLKVGAQGIVGYVTSTGEARVALDTGEDAHHFNTPELPNTRSEMALPLFAGGRLFGALDVQSTEQNAFSEEDITALRVLADQVAMAINNAQLFEQLQQSLESERLAYGEISRNSWQNLLKNQSNWGFRYGNRGTRRVEGDWPEDMMQVIKSNQMAVAEQAERPTLLFPIKIADSPIGVIRLQKDSPLQQWSQDEINLVQTLVDRMTQSLESARLYQSTQLQAAQEQLTGEISSKIRETLDIDNVLKTAAKELGQALKAKEVVIRMNTEEA